MKAVVIKRLNKRIARASVNADKLTPYEPGDIVEVVDILNGDDIDGNSIWYQLDDGTYVWSGGIAGNKDMPIMNAEENTNPSNGALQWWHTQFGIPEIWSKGYRGQDVKVAILDSGINVNHIEFNGGRISLLNGKSASTIYDKDGHGTMCAGVVGAKGVSKCSGIAPDAELMVDQVYLSPVDGYAASTLVNSINNAISAGADVISLSLGGTTDEDEIKQINAALKQAEQKGIVVVAAIGNNGNATGDFPAISDYCISIGAVGQGMELSSFTNRYSKLDLCAPGEEMFTPSIKNRFKPPSNTIEENSFYKMAEGTSFATPYVAGVVALMLSKEKKTPQQVKEELLASAKVNNSNGFEYRLINPQQIFK